MGAGWSALAGPAATSANNPPLATDQKIAVLESRINALEMRVRKLESKPDNVNGALPGPDKGGGPSANRGPTATGGGTSSGGSVFSLNSIRGQIHRVVAPF